VTAHQAANRAKNREEEFLSVRIIRVIRGYFF